MLRPSIERLLPAVYQRAALPGGVLAALLDAMETLHAPTEEALTAVEDLFHPYRTPDRLVPFLARWVALDHVLPRSRAGVTAAADEVSRLPIPIGRLRELVADAAGLAQRRGTATGLRMFLEKAMGVAGFSVEEPAGRPFHVVVRVPPAAAHQIELVRRIVALEKPAAITCEVLAVEPEATPTPEEES
jgi:phage tail-like protein